MEEEIQFLFDIIKDVDEPNKTTTYYCILDSKEGSDCFGHWIHECALFLPYVQVLRNRHPTLKILLHCKRRFKLNTLIDFGFTEDDVEYSNLFSDSNKCICSSWYDNMNKGHLYHGWVLPETHNYVTYLPKIPFVNIVEKENIILQKIGRAFKEFYGVYSYTKEKTIPILYLIRSRKENYNSPNKRDFLNMNEMIELLKKYNVEILDIDTLSSIREQAEKVQQAKILIHEFSAANVNSLFFSVNSHSLVLNKQPVGQNLIDISEYFIHESGSSWEFFLTTTEDWHKVVINLSQFEQRLQELIEKYNLQIENGTF